MKTDAETQTNDDRDMDALRLLQAFSDVFDASSKHMHPIPEPVTMFGTKKKEEKRKEDKPKDKEPEGESSKQGVFFSVMSWLGKPKTDVPMEIKRKDVAVQTEMTYEELKGIGQMMKGIFDKMI